MNVRNVKKLVLPAHDKIIFLIICSSFLFKLLIWFRLSNNNDNFLENDSKSYYLPATQEFFRNYLDFTNNTSNLGAQVTPIFPVFLKIVLPLGISGAILINLVLSTLTIYFVYLVGKKILGKGLGILSALIISIEGSYFFSSLLIAPEIIFTLLITLHIYFLIAQPFKISNINYLCAGLVLALAILTRPIGISILLSLILAMLVAPSLRNRQTIFTILFSGFFVVAWLLRNLIIHGVPNISTISAHNIHYYEGAASKAEALNISLEITQANEVRIQSVLIGNSPTIGELYKYDNDRGFELIRQYPIAFLKMHVYGAFRVIFGPGKSSIHMLLSNGLGIRDSKVELGIAIIFFLLLIFIVGTSLISIPFIWRSNRTFALLSLVIIGSLLAVSSGSVGYSRFRVPLAPILSILSAYGFMIIYNQICWRIRTFKRV